MTDKELIELRIKCVEVFVPALSRAGIDKGEAFTLGKQLWDESLKALEEYQTPRSSKKKS